MTRESTAAVPVRRLGGPSFLIEDKLKIYVDPVRIGEGLPAADIVLLTRHHPEHCSVPDVMRIATVQTIVAGSAEAVCRFRLNQLAFEPGQTKLVLGAPITAVASGGGLGFIVELDGARIELPEPPRAEEAKP